MALEVNEIVALREEFRRIWSRTHNHWQTVIDPWVWGTPNIWGRSRRSTTIPSTARNIIEHASDTQLVWEPKFHRPPVGRGSKKKRQEEADAVEAGLRAVFFDAMLKEIELTFKAAGKYMGPYGYAIIEGPTMEFEDRPEEPVRDDYDDEDEYRWALIDYRNARAVWNPIRIRAPHPTSVLLDPSERSPSEAIEYGLVAFRKLKRIIDSARQRERKPDYLISEEAFRSLKPDGTGNISRTGYWSKDEHQIIVANEVILAEKNLLGYVPFNHGFTGWGIRSSRDDQNDPFYLAQGLLDPILDSLKTQAQWTSAKTNALIERSYLRIGTSGDAAELGQQLNDEDSIIEGTDKEVWYLKYPELERTLFQIGQEVSEDIEMGTFSRSIAGMRQQGVSTVGQQAILSTAATRKFANPNKQLNMMATIIGQRILQLVNRYGEVITVGGEKLDPAQIHDDYSVIAEFQTLDPILQMQEREIGLREVDAGILSDVSYRENILRVANESLEFRRLIEQVAMKDPRLMKVLVDEVHKQNGVLDLIEKAEEEEAVAAAEDAAPGETPQITDQAGGGATRALRRPLTPDTANFPRTSPAR